MIEPHYEDGFDRLFDEKTNSSKGVKQLSGRFTQKMGRVLICQRYWGVDQSLRTEWIQRVPRLLRESAQPGPHPPQITVNIHKARVYVMSESRNEIISKTQLTGKGRSDST